MSYVNGKTILLTNVRLKNYAGSEINCLSLAEFFQKQGTSVEVATLEYGMPIKGDFEKAGIDVKVIPEQKLSRTKYDLIWAHHSIVIDWLLFSENISADKIIISSLSAFEPYEAPPIYTNSCSLCLANSEETKEKLLSEGILPENIILFPNYVEKDWLANSMPKKIPSSPQNIVIISNHIAPELLEAKLSLEKRNLNVDIYGEQYESVMISPDLLQKYDLIISIGKTVQYAMALQIPLYCYDIYGGPGYLDQDNMAKASFHNFSGRGFPKKTSGIIVEEILSGYSSCLEFQTKLLTYIKKNCILEKNMKKVLQFIKKQKPLDIQRIKCKYAIVGRHNHALVRAFPENKKLI